MVLSFSRVGSCKLNIIKIYGMSTALPRLDFDRNHQRQIKFFNTMLANKSIKAYTYKAYT